MFSAKCITIFESKSDRFVCSTTRKYLIYRRSRVNLVKSDTSHLREIELYFFNNEVVYSRSIMISDN